MTERPSEAVFRDIIFQTDPRLPETFRRFGCRVACLMAIPQFVARRALDIGQYVDVIERAMGMPSVIINDLWRCGSEEHWLIDEVFRVFGVQRRGRQVGWAAEHLAGVQWEYMIAHWRTQGADGHFTLHDRQQAMVYDPHRPEQVGGRTIDMREITRELLYRTWPTA